MRLKRLIRQFLIVNGVIILGSLVAAILLMVTPDAAIGQLAASIPEGVVGWGFLSAAIAVGLGALGAGIAVGMVGAAAIGTIGERPELLGRTLIFVGLAEGIAIYGLVIAIMILGRL